MSDEAPPQSPLPRRSWLLAPFLVLVVLAAALALSWPEIQPLISGPTVPQPIAPPIAAAAPVTPAPVVTAAPAPPADVSALTERISHLEKSSADAAAVLRLLDRLNQVETDLRQVQSRHKGDAAVVLAVALLKEAVDRGAPFDTELRTLKVLSPDDPDIAKLVDQLKPRSAAGIPSRAILAGRFAALETAVLRADTIPVSVGAGWQRHVLERVLTLFTLRREDGLEDGDNPAAILARARTALDHNDWPQTVQTLSGLSGEAAKAAQSWLDDAQSRLLADRLIADAAAQAVAAAGVKL